MTDLTITAANVSGVASGRGKAGEAIAAGQPVALVGGSLMLADADGGASATADLRKPVGVALNNAASGQPVAYASDVVTLGAVLTAGTEYWLSATAGGIAPRADVTTGMTPVLLGVATSTSKLKLALINAGVEL